MLQKKLSLEEQTHKSQSCEERLCVGKSDQSGLEDRNIPLKMMLELNINER